MPFLGPRRRGRLPEKARVCDKAKSFLGATSSLSLGAEKGRKWCILSFCPQVTPTGGHVHEHI